MKRKFCCRCYQTTDDYTTEHDAVYGYLVSGVYGWQQLAWHTCRVCAPAGSVTR